MELPDAFCTGSSLMPQKKNPDACELLRGKAARLQGNLQTLLALVKGLPLTYNRDLQEDKPPVFDSFDQTALCLEVLAGLLAGLKVNRRRCAAAVADPALFATDLADYLVLQGVPFREAHHAVGAVVRLAEQHALPLDRFDACASPIGPPGIWPRLARCVQPAAGHGEAPGPGHAGTRPDPAAIGPMEENSRRSLRRGEVS